MGKGASSLRQRQRERIQVEKTEAKTHNLDQNLDNAFKDFLTRCYCFLSCGCLSSTENPQKPKWNMVSDQEYVVQPNTYRQHHMCLLLSQFAQNISLFNTFLYHGYLLSPNRLPFTRFCFYILITKK